MKRKGIWLAAVASLAAGIISAQEDSWEALMNRGNALRTRGDFAAANQAYVGALRVAEGFGPADTRLASTLLSLAIVYDELGNTAEAERQYRRALHVAEKCSGKDSPDYAHILVDLAGLYLDENRTAEGEAMIRQAIGIYDGRIQPDDARFIQARECLAELLSRQGNLVEAENLLTKAVDALGKRTGTGVDLVIATNNLGMVRELQGRHQEAIATFDNALGIVETRLTADHPLAARLWNNLAIAYYRTGRNTDAGQAFQHSISIAEKRLGREHPAYGKLLTNYSSFLQKTGRKAEAKKLEAQAKNVQIESARRNGTGMTVDVSAFRRP
jgi:tetratricopeptide (TPR) repeat protein